jgi:threonyl-tRNA synthetase
LDDRSERLQAKIRDAQLQQIPYMLILGAKEVANQTVSVRSRDAGDLGSMDLTEITSKLQ